MLLIDVSDSNSEITTIFPNSQTTDTSAKSPWRHLERYENSQESIVVTTSESLYAIYKRLIKLIPSCITDPSSVWIIDRIDE